MADLHVPSALEATVRAIARRFRRDPQTIFEEVLAEGLARVKKRAFDRVLLENDAALQRGEFVIEEQSIARVEAVERGE